MKCINPTNVADALKGLWAGSMVVLATLKSNIARVVSIGAAIGAKAGKLAKPKLQKLLYEYYPEHKSWVDFFVTGIFAFIGIVVSMFLTR
jgi:hypothetical protein